MTTPDPAAIIRTQLAAWATEASELRSFDYPSVAAQPAEVLEAVVEVRGKLDRIEEILVSATRLKSGTIAAQKNAEDAAQDAWDRQAEADRNRQVREYEGAEERYARWRLATLMELRASRQARALAVLAGQVHEDVKTKFYGLRDIRGELLERGRQFTLESNLER